MSSWLQSLLPDEAVGLTPGGGNGGDGTTHARDCLQASLSWIKLKAEYSDGYSQMTVANIALDVLRVGLELIGVTLFPIGIVVLFQRQQYRQAAGFFFRLVGATIGINALGAILNFSVNDKVSNLVAAFNIVVVIAMLAILYVWKTQQANASRQAYPFELILLKRWAKALFLWNKFLGREIAEEIPCAKCGNKCRYNSKDTGDHYRSFSVCTKCGYRVEF